MKKFALGALVLTLTGYVFALGALSVADAVLLAALVGAASLGMAVLDERTEFCDAVSVAAAAGTALVGDVIDTSVIRDHGSGERALWFVITVDTEIITGGAAGTIEFLLASDAQAAIATDGTATVHFRSRAFVTDDAAANDAALNVGGRPVCVKLPTEGPAYERYLGVLIVTGTTTTTAGKINAFLCSEPPKGWKAYPDAL